MTWSATNTTVRSEIQLSYTFLPLTFHHAVWIPHKLIPYLLDNCEVGPHPCIMEQYMEFAFLHMTDLLDSYNKTQDDLIFTWASEVAMEFGLPVKEIIDVYSPYSDTHNSEMRTRQMFKLNTANHVSGTPFGFVNGILLETFPHTAEDWMVVLNSVYESQYKPKL